MHHLSIPSQAWFSSSPREDDAYRNHPVYIPESGSQTPVDHPRETFTHPSLESMGIFVNIFSASKPLRRRLGAANAEKNTPA